MNALWQVLLGSTDTAVNHSSSQGNPDDVPQPWQAEQDYAAEATTPGQEPTPLGRTASLHPDAATQDAFSALEQRDRVVIMLLFDQVVREDQVELAWQLWRQMSSEGTKEPLWRVLTLFPELDRDLIYAEAARVYGFEEARLSRPRALDLIQRLEQQLDRQSWDQLVELRVVPVNETPHPDTLRPRLVFATQDPTHPDVHRLLPTLGLESFELRYAPEDEILSLLIEAFPHRYNHLKGLSGVTKDFLAGLVPAEAKPVLLPGLDTRFRNDVLDVFDDVLAAAVRQGATDVCLLPTATGETEVYLQIDDDLRRQRVIDYLPADAVIAGIKRDVIGAEDCGEGRIQKRHIEREIDSRLARFRVSAVPASEEVHAECIVVRVLG